MSYRCGAEILAGNGLTPGSPAPEQLGELHRCDSSYHRENDAPNGQPVSGELTGDQPSQQGGARGDVGHQCVFVLGVRPPSSGAETVQGGRP